MMTSPTVHEAPALMLKTEGPVPQSPKDAENPQDDTVSKDAEVWYVCRKCHQRLTQPNAHLTVRGSHRHTFANPSGVVFEVVCFSAARGFSTMGQPSLDFTWFSGYSWRILVCSACLTHIGWMFEAPDKGRFFGLIADRLSLLSMPEG